MVEMKKEENSS